MRNLRVFVGIRARRVFRSSCFGLFVTMRASFCGASSSAPSFGAIGSQIIQKLTDLAAYKIISGQIIRFLADLAANNILKYASLAQAEVTMADLFTPPPNS